MNCEYRLTRRSNACSTGQRYKWAFDIGLNVDRFIFDSIKFFSFLLFKRKSLIKIFSNSWKTTKSTLKFFRSHSISLSVLFSFIQFKNSSVQFKLKMISPPSLHTPTKTILFYNQKPLLSVDWISIVSFLFSRFLELSWNHLGNFVSAK